MAVVLMGSLSVWLVGVLVQTFALYARKNTSFGWVLIVLGGAGAVFAGMWLGWARALGGGG